MVDTGFRIRSGTAKTSDGALAMSFEESSQGHWCIKCTCGKYNIAAPDQQLFQMIGRHGCSCAYCGRVLDVTTGYYVFKYPSRVYTHIGYHMPQIIFDFHNTKGGWGEILYKKNNWGKTEFLNEVLGVPDDDSVRLLSKGDLLKARNNVRDKATAVRLKSSYDMCVLGVDWGGGGGGDSATGIAVIAKNNNAQYFECLYMNRLPQGLTPEQEADAVASLANEFEVDYIAHDYTGAGFVRESLFISKHPGWQPYMYPVSYTYKPTSDLVTVSTSGSRTSYTVDKTKSLLLTINCIKYGALFLPWFDEKDPNAVQLDFLAIIEHHQSLKEDAGGKNTVLRSSEVYLLDKVAGKLQHFAIGHQKAFLTVVFGFIVFSFSLNIYRMGQVWSFHQTAISAIEQQDEMLRNRHKRIKEAISSNHVNAENHGKNQKTNKENDGHTEED